jgi:plastocyanin
VSEFRKRVLGPALIPIGAFVFIGALVFAFSRILLAVPKNGSVVVGILMAGCVLLGAGALSKGGSLKRAQRVALGAFGVALIAGGAATGASLGVRPIKGELPVGATLVAHNIAFDKKEIAFNADKPLAIEFTNDDAGTPHNVAIYDTPAAAKSVFVGDIFQGVATRRYPLPKGLPKGIYFFRCDVHHQMNGTLNVGNAAGGPASPSAGGTPTTIDLVAKGTKFDTKTLTFNAGGTVTINFDNRDAGTQHDFALYTDSSATTNLFRGPVVVGPTKATYVFAAPGAGTYFFRCEIHPSLMFGTVTVH